MENEIFYAVMLDGKGVPTVKHSSYEAAENEARRLCQKEQCKAYVMKLMTMVEVGPVIVTKLDSSIINKQDDAK